MGAKVGKMIEEAKEKQVTELDFSHKKIPEVCCAKPVLVQNNVCAFPALLLSIPFECTLFVLIVFHDWHCVHCRMLLGPTRLARACALCVHCARVCVLICCSIVHALSRI